MIYEKLRTVQNRFVAELLGAALERSGVDFYFHFNYADLITLN